IPSAQSPQPLIKMERLIAERTGTGKDAAGAYFRLNPKVSDLPQKYWLEVNGVKLLVLGAIEQAGAGCACPQGAFLRAMLTHTILQRQEVVLVDLAAGVEFMGRASIQGVDAVVVVVEPGSRSIETAKNITRMARELGVKHVAAIVNKITKGSQIEAIRGELTDITTLANIRYSPLVQKADLEQKNVFAACPELVEQLRQAKNMLMDLISNS
ncbi:MAG: hypothetical protein MUO27_00635, partial [Sedimentisphaerales bacterium]|nr:hypothetical protein [Sedimentisphaerales bacterium]